MLAATGVDLAEVMAELERREGTSGLAEKASRPKELIMDELAKEVSPFHRFSREEWAALRADTPMTLIQADLDELRSLNDRIDLTEVETIYLPLSRLLTLYVAATQGLFRATNHFLHLNDRKVPYIIGMAGSVAVGKSTTARILQRLLARWPQPAEGRSRHHRRIPPAQRQFSNAKA